MNILETNFPKMRLAALSSIAACALFTLPIAQQASAQSGYGADLRELNKEVRDDLALLKRSTSAFNSYDVARAAGWNAVISDCVESPEGGMGYHVANIEALDGSPFELSILRPEVLLYAPLPDGSMELLGVEYIVPYTPDNASNPPEMLGQKLQYNPHLQIWALHVWTERHNPSGIFAPFNPEVSCPAD